MCFTPVVRAIGVHTYRSIRTLHPLHPYSPIIFTCSQVTTPILTCSLVTPNLTWSLVTTLNLTTSPSSAHPAASHPPQDIASWAHDDDDEFLQPSDDDLSMMDDAFTTSDMSDDELLFSPHMSASRRKLQLDVVSIVSTINTVITLVSSADAITFNSFELSLSLVSGGSPMMNASYSLTVKGGTPLTGNFSLSPDTTKTGRHLLESGGLKDMVIKKLVQAVIGYVKKTYPTIGALLPKTSDCATSSGRDNGGEGTQISLSV